VLHIGDHDPSGVHMFSAIAEDVQTFAQDLGLDGSIRFTRLAVTPAQIVDLKLTTAPPKVEDRRAFTGETTQCEAIPPDVLAQIVTDAIEARLDRRAYHRVLAAEQEIQGSLTPRLAALLADMGGAS